MNRPIIVYTLGRILQVISLFFLVPIIVGFIYKETTVSAYIIGGALSLLTGLVLSIKKPTNYNFYLREGCFITVLSWLAISVFCAIPFIITGEINDSIVDSVFETISGLTTTGATVLSSVEDVSNCTNIWRCELHWIGGLGVLVFLMAVIPLAGGTNINILKSESSSSKLVPKIMTTARILYIVYGSLTLLNIIILLLGNTPLFDSICIAFSTAGTGGFGIKNTSLAGYSDFVQWVTTVFMLMFSVNISIYYFIAIRNFKKAFASDELKVFLGMIVVYFVIIYIDFYANGALYDNCVKDILFTMSAIISTTGFAVTDFIYWPILSQCLILLMLLIGGCVGSTAGGFKVSKVMILLKSVWREISLYIHPKKVSVIKMNKETLSEDTLHSTTAFFIVYITTFVVSSLLVSVNEADLITNFTAVATTLNNVGPGMSAAIGPSGNFGFFNDFTKIILMFDMLAGRLGLFPLLIFFHRSVWKDLFRHSSK